MELEDRLPTRLQQRARTATHGSTSGRRTTIALSFALLLFVMLVHSGALLAQEPRGRAAFERHVLPVLKTYCADCHSRANADQRWTFDGYMQLAPGFGRADGLAAFPLRRQHRQPARDLMSVFALPVTRGVRGCLKTPVGRRLRTYYTA
jgi:hypothetical protein